MTPLAISILDAHPAPQTASPAVMFHLRIANAAGGPVRAIALRCQVRIDPRLRRYTADEQERLYELFGEAAQWDRSLGPVTWTQASVAVPSFEREIEIELPVACTYDLEVAAAKYLHGLRGGDVPLVFLFSGTVFIVNAGSLSIEPVSWDVEAAFRMPARVWRAAMDQFFPGGGWIRLQQETIDRLQAFRGRQAVVTWDEALDLLLQRALEERTA